MDTDTRRTRMLTDIIELTQTMLVMAREHEWERVALLEAERRVLVQDCFAHPTREQDAPGVAAAIREILCLNEEVARCAGSWKEQIGADIHTQSVGRSAAAVYRSHAR